MRAAYLPQAAHTAVPTTNDTYHHYALFIRFASLAQALDQYLHSLLFLQTSTVATFRGLPWTNDLLRRSKKSGLHSMWLCVQSHGMGTDDRLRLLILKTVPSG